MILQCGEKERAVVAFADTSVCFEPPSKFSIDGVTEKVTEILRPIPQTALTQWPSFMFWESWQFCNFSHKFMTIFSCILSPATRRRSWRCRWRSSWARWIFPYFNISWARWKFSVSLVHFQKSTFSANERERRRSGVSSLQCCALLWLQTVRSKIQLVTNTFWKHIKKMPLRRLATDMQDKHDMPLITADDTVGFFFK